MQLVFIVLNKVECLEDLLTSFANNGIGGATILDSMGMARVLSQNEGLSMFGSLSLLFNPDHEESKTIFTVLPAEKIEIVKKCLIETVGDLSKPDTGIMFGVPLAFSYGLGSGDKEL